MPTTRAIALLEKAIAQMIKAIVQRYCTIYYDARYTGQNLPATGGIV